MADDNDTLVGRLLKRLEGHWALIGLIVGAIAALSGGLDRAFLAHGKWFYVAFAAITVAALLETFAGQAWRRKWERVWLVRIAVGLVAVAFLLAAVAYVRTGGGDDTPAVRVVIDDEKREATISVEARYFDPNERLGVGVWAFPPTQRYLTGAAAGTYADPLLDSSREGGSRLLNAEIGADGKGSLSWSQTVDLPPDAQRISVEAGEQDRTQADCWTVGSRTSCVFVAIPLDPACDLESTDPIPDKCALLRALRGRSR